MDQPRPFGGAPEPPPSPRPKEQENVPAVLVFLTALFLSLIAYKALQKPAPAPSEEPGAWAPPPARAPGEDDRMQVVAEKPALPASRPISPPDGLPRSAAARRRDELRRRRAEELTRARERFRKDGLRRLDGRSLLDAAPEEAPQQEAPPIAPERPAPPGGGGDAGAPSQPSDSVVRVQTPPAEETPKPAADKLGVESSAVAAPYPAGIAAAWESIRASGQDGARLYD
ncbi:MAG TPA: hypothetical protein VNI01_11345, partial [Elusimicrobiota bacterium]|nr:hypothetical protein [Elusimicrobiota bacterium]